MPVDPDSPEIIADSPEKETALLHYAIDNGMWWPTERIDTTTQIGASETFMPEVPPPVAS